MSELLSVSNLEKSYRTRYGPIRAVDGVTFEVQRGQTVALVGESGCGKSTIALSLIRLVDTDSGQMLFDGESINTARGDRLRRLRQQMSIVFQNPYSSLNPKMRVRDIVGEPLKTCYGIRGKPLRERVAKHLLEVGLGAEHVERFPHEFSGGQRQRIAIARALALEPKLLILDEPTAALDVSVQAQVLNLLRDLQRRLGLSYLFISHNLATVEFIADQILVMYLGRIVERGPVAEVFDSPQHPYTRALLDSVPSTNLGHRNHLKPLTGDVASPLDRRPGCAFMPRCRFATERCGESTPWLEDIDSLRAVACHHPLGREKAS